MCTAGAAFKILTTHSTAKKVDSQSHFQNVSLLQHWFFVIWFSVQMSTMSVVRNSPSNAWHASGSMCPHCRLSDLLLLLCDLKWDTTLQVINAVFLCYFWFTPAVHDLYCQTREPSYRWQTRATRKHAKNCPYSTCLQRCRWQYCSYIHTYSCCCVRNLRNPEKFSEN